MKINYNGNIALLSEIGKINDTNYWEIIEKEKNFIEENIDFINIKLDINDKETIFFLMENNYVFKNKEDNFYILEKECFKYKSWRVSLTEECNYRCFFCHEEGLAMGTKRKPKTREEVYDLIKLGIENKYNDITFTGGEPLIKWRDIVWYLGKLEEDNLKPAITIVTNGYLITDELLDAVEKYNKNGSFKFNFSMHSLDEEKYLKITNPKTNHKNIFETVKKNILKIKERNLELKLNFVLLKDFNTSKEDVREILDFAYKNNVDYIKFLELLVTEDLIKKKMYQFYFSLDFLYQDWKDEIKFYRRAPRRYEYLYKEKVKIELQQCLCMEGCSKCLIHSSVFLTAELKYFPCFLLSTKNYALNSNNLIGEIEKGNQLVKSFGEKYGNSSPLLTKQKEYISEKEEYYYISKYNYSQDDYDNILLENGYKKYDKRDFLEIYFKPINLTKEEYFSKGIIYKLFRNSSASQYVEVIQEINKNENGQGFHITFLNKKFNSTPKIILNDEKEFYTNYMKKINYEEFLTLDWETLTYKKGENIISLGLLKNNGRIIFMSNRKISDKNLVDKLGINILERLAADEFGREKYE